MQTEPDVIKASTQNSPRVRRPAGSTSSSALGRLPEKMQPLLLLVALLLSPKAEAGEIIGGNEAEPHSRPYMAYVRYTSNNKSKFCGGFLVREDFVLTAAHCLGSSTTVTLGAHNIKVKENSQQVIPVKTPIPHPKYNNPAYANDIMLLQLKDKAKLNAAVGTIDLPGIRDKVEPGMTCSVAGWGSLGVNTPGPAKLHEVELEIQRDQECIHLYQYYYNNAFQICVGDPTKIQSSFEGDSGGPLVCGKKAQGIVSFGKTNGKPPGIYTRIKYFLSWIKRTMKRFKLRGPD